MTDPQNPGEAADESQIYADPRIVEIEGRRKKAVSALMMIVSVSLIAVILIAVLTFVTESIPSSLGLVLMLVLLLGSSLANFAQQKRIKTIDQESKAARAELGGSAPQL